MCKPPLGHNRIPKNLSRLGEAFFITDLVVQEVAAHLAAPPLPPRSPYIKKDIARLEKESKRSTKIIRQMEHLPLRGMAEVWDFSVVHVVERVDKDFFLFPLRYLKAFDEFYLVVQGIGLDGRGDPFQFYDSMKRKYFSTQRVIKIFTAFSSLLLLTLD